MTQGFTIGKLSLGKPKKSSRYSESGSQKSPDKPSDSDSSIPTNAAGQSNSKGTKKGKQRTVKGKKKNDNNEHERQKTHRISNNPRGQGSLFSLLDFKNKTQSHTNSVNLSTSIYKINLQKKSFNPLQNHNYKPKKFPILKVFRTEYYDEVKYGELFEVSGEDNPIHGYFREEMRFLFFDINYNAQFSMLIFNCLISRAAYALIMQSERYMRLQKKLEVPQSTLLSSFIKFTDDAERYETGTKDYDQDTENATMFVQKYESKFPKKRLNAFHTSRLVTKLYGYKLAKESIELLNNPQLLDNQQFAILVRNLFYYSMISIGLTFFDEEGYNSVIAFVNGSVSTTLVKPILDKLSTLKALPNFNKNSTFLNQFQFVQRVFIYMHSYHVRNINSLYMPNYNLDVLFEFRDNFSAYITELLKNDHRLVNLLVKSPVAQQQHNDGTKAKQLHYKLLLVLAFSDQLQDFINNDLLSEENIAIDKKRHNYNRVCIYEPKKMFELLKKYLKMYPYNNSFNQSNFPYMCLLEKFFHLYRIALSSMLDNIFPETLYLFIIRFTGITLFDGFDMSFINSMYHDLDYIFKKGRYAKADTETYNQSRTIIDDLLKDNQKDNDRLYKYLCHNIAYLARVVSFFMYRHRIYLRNLMITNPYPKSSLFELVRLDSRKVPGTYISENQIHSFVHEKIKFENYPRKNLRYNQQQHMDQLNSDDELYMAKPNNPRYMIFNDSNFTIDENRDENYHSVQNFLASKAWSHQLYAPETGSPRQQITQVAEFNLYELPVEHLQFSKYGLLKNIDYRPNIDTVPNNYMNLNSVYYTHNETILNDYTVDREIVLGIPKHNARDSIDLNNAGLAINDDAIDAFITNDVNSDQY